MDDNKKKNHLKNSFKTNKFRYGGYATISTLVLVAILIVVNLVVGELNVKIDLTPNSNFSLQDTTNTILGNLEEDITIYALYEAGKEQVEIMEILDRYQSTSKKIKIETKDPLLNPGFVEQYKTSTDEGIPTGSLIVTGADGKRSKVIRPYDMYSINYYTQTQTLNLEQAVTSAIDYVTKEELPEVFVVQGHNESTISPIVENQLSGQNYEVKQVNLLTDDIEAAKDNVIIISSPKVDFTEEETTKVLDFLAGGGRGLIFTDYNTPEMENFNKILKRYGVASNAGVVVEGNTSNMVGGYLTVLIPNIESHEVMDKLKTAGLSIVMPQAAALVELEEKKSQTKIEPLLTTSKDAFLRIDPNEESIEKVEGDIPGPLHLAYAISEENYNDIENKTTTTKLMVVSSSLIMDQSLLASSGNLDFLMSGMNWLSEQTESISILPRDSMPERLTVNQAQALLYTGFFIILLPLIILAYGISVWLRRRHL